ncbi:hypothetical protein LCB40_00450 [Lactobacillus corticis]|uniref:Uncharacterized protein n=1 Tax=Lactobacillus corticis TaxID=2201249 RepID=A0A916QF62_9LACO|nr:hypothetical protein LCB40_00450 [Lactobacillus corticis]
MVDNLLAVSETKKSFISEHWLLRYEILYRYRTNNIFKTDINQYYRGKKKKTMNYDFFMSKSKCGERKQNEDYVNCFFSMLLEENVSFTNFND